MIVLRAQVIIILYNFLVEVIDKDKGNPFRYTIIILSLISLVNTSEVTNNNNSNSHGWYLQQLLLLMLLGLWET